MERKVLGAFSEYLLLPAHVVMQNLYHKPYELSFEEAALLEPFSCVVHPYTKIRLSTVKTALVIGSGPIGLMHLAFLNRNGVRVLISDPSSERLSVAFGMKAERAVSPGEVEYVVKDATDGLGVDLVIECTGQIDVWERSVSYVRRGGMVILFGGCPSGTRVSYDTHRLHYDELSLLGSFHFTPQDVKTAYHLLTEGEVNLSPLISGEFPLRDIEKAFALLMEGRGIKYALKP
jgi:L-iditol 2-dehydrogenase